jgi:hypothetical protein
MIRRKKAVGKKLQEPDKRGRAKEARHGTRHWTTWRREKPKLPVVR